MQHQVLHHPGYLWHQLLLVLPSQADVERDCMVRVRRLSGGAARFALEVGEKAGDCRRLHLFDNLVEREEGILTGGGLPELGHAMPEQRRGGVNFGTAAWGGAAGFRWRCGRLHRRTHFAKSTEIHVRNPQSQAILHLKLSEQTSMCSSRDGALL